MNPETIAALRAAGLDPADTVSVVRAALDEDFRYGPDITSEATVTGQEITVEVVAREPGVLAGIPVALTVLDAASRPQPSMTVGISDRIAARTAHDHDPVVVGADGELVVRGEVVLRMSGHAPFILGIERTVLNFLTHLSGIATETRAWTDAVAGTGAVIRDTRKTLPGLRALQKYAVRCGGGQNHRMGLGDAALIKDNHVAAAGGVAPAIRAVRGYAPGVPLEAECDTLAQVRESLEAGARFILLDNMDLSTMRAAVRIARGFDGVRLEASGGLRLENARDVASTGVDYLAVGALTHSSRALDLGVDITT
jgi:nicotinate-nucleotide pyrophosphorylase (carboxylating)